jgi:hypothetical protein
VHSKWGAVSLNLFCVAGMGNLRRPHTR